MNMQVMAEKEGLPKTAAVGKRRRRTPETRRNESQFMEKLQRRKVVPLLS